MTDINIAAVDKARAEQNPPVGEAGRMPGTSGFTMCCFEASKVPLGTKLPAQQSTVPDGWQPIETAPKDGSEMLLYGDLGYMVLYWDKNAEMPPFMWSSAEEGICYHKDAFTHWRPLPAAPTYKEKEEKPPICDLQERITG